MTRPRIVGIAGHAGSGKSVVADYLMESYGYQRVKLAGPLKDALSAMGLTEREIEGDLKETPCDLLCGKTPRHAMITLGTEWGRDMIGPNLWTNTWARKASKLLEQGFHVVCDDVRFPNEADAVRALGGAVIRIERLGLSAIAHVSEVQNFAVDWTIPNIGTIGELRRRVDEVLALASERAA